MKEIKFRAFRILRDEPEEGDVSIMTLPFTLANLQDGDQFDFTDGGCLGADEFGLAHPDTIIMQFTGLHDKSGHEIYESDIISWDRTRYSAKEGFIGPVIWESSYAGWRVDYPFFVGGPMLMTNLEELEIIGNIFSNPELLGKEIGD